MSSLPVPLSIPVLGWALRDAVFKLNPFSRLRNPAIFMVGTCAVLVTVAAVHDLWTVGSARRFDIQIALWLWVTVLCANFAEALGEVRERVRADSLRRSRRDTLATRITGRKTRILPASKLRMGDIIIIKAGELIPVDGEVVEGLAMVDESVVTGESAPVLRESSSDQSTVTSGSRVLSDEIRVRVTRAPAETLVEKMISALENTTQEHTPDEVALQTFTSIMALICVVGATVLFVFARFTADKDNIHGAATVAEGSALLAAMLPVTLGALLSTTGAAAMGRLVQGNVLAISRRSLEAVYNLTIVFLDKTGTVTGGNRHAVAFIPSHDIPSAELLRAAALASLGDETTEGRSTLELANLELASLGLAGNSIPPPLSAEAAKVVPFSSYTRMSGTDISGHVFRKGAADAIADYVAARGGAIPSAYKENAERISRAGGTPLGVCEDARILGIIHLVDSLKPNLRPRIEKLRTMGIRTVLITGDNPVTASAIARELGTDEVVAHATPADKLAAIKREQARGEIIAMAGDETNDAPALAQANLGLVMNNGSNAAKEAGDMLDLDSDPAKIVEITALARDVRVTRVSLMFFSVTVSLSQFLLVLPALLTPMWPWLDRLNFLDLRSPHSAMLSTTIFKSICILGLLPVAWNGVLFWPVSMTTLLRRNVALFAVAGLLLPVPFLWALDRILVILDLTQ